LDWIPSRILHTINNTVFEQDIGFLASQNETLVQRNVATTDLYLNLKSLDTWVTEYQKWLDLTGHGMPYYFGHRSALQSPNLAIAEAAPAGLVAATASSYPAKGSFGAIFARDPTNWYFWYVVHCKSCLGFAQLFQEVPTQIMRRIFCHFLWVVYEQSTGDWLVVIAVNALQLG